MALYFITGNAGKLAELQSIIPAIEAYDLDLPEIQQTDARIIIEHKLTAARAKLQHESAAKQTALVVEDTSLHFEALGGLPGPLIKWFLQSVGTEGLAQLAHKLGNTRATARTYIGYLAYGEEPRYFEGVVHGSIVAPRGEAGFGWDRIFQPDGHDKTFAEMTAGEKNTLSMRRLAAEKLRAAIGSTDNAV